MTHIEKKLCEVITTWRKGSPHRKEMGTATPFITLPSLMRRKEKNKHDKEGTSLITTVVSLNVGNKLINEKRWAYLYARCSPTIMFLPTSLLAIVVHRRSVVAVFVEPCADAAGCRCCRCCSCCSCPHAAVVVADRWWWLIVDLGVLNNHQTKIYLRLLDLRL